MDVDNPRVRYVPEARVGFVALDVLDDVAAGPNTKDCGFIGPYGKVQNLAKVKRDRVVCECFD
jgi:hypothetical protein